MIGKPALIGGRGTPRFAPVRICTLLRRRSGKVAHLSGHQRFHCPVHAQASSSFTDLRSSADQAYARACELLPALEQAQGIARDARTPATEAEQQWQDAHSRLSDVTGKAHAAINELRDGAELALGGAEEITSGMMRHHARFRLESFKQSLSEVSFWKAFSPEVTPLTWLNGAAVLTQAAACTSQDTTFLIACVSVAMPPLHDNLRSILLHWSVADGPGAAWANSIPQGWHTSPSVSQPCGATAWQTNFGPYAPVVSGEAATSAVVFSVVVQIPIDGFLEERGGLKFVLKRTDGCQPEWIKPGNNADFWLDFEKPIAGFQKIREQEEAAARAAAAALLPPATTLPSSSSFEQDTTAGLADTSSSSENGSVQGPLPADSLDQWGWARTMSSEDSSSSGSDSENQGPEAVKAQVLVEEQRKADEERGRREREEAELEASDAAVASKGWLASVTEWQALGDYPPQQPASLSRQVQQLRLILSAAQAHSAEAHQGQMDGASDEFGAARHAQQQEKIGALLTRCHEVDETLQIYDAASFEARRTQQQKERLWEMYKEASDEASHLQAEVSAALDAARRTAAALRGRPAEVTQRDLEAVASQMAESSCSGGASGMWPFSAFGAGLGGSPRQLAFVSQYVSPIAGIEGAVVAQVHLEGEKSAVQAALAPKTDIKSDSNPPGDGSQTTETSTSSSSSPSSANEGVASSTAVEDASLSASSLEGQNTGTSTSNTRTNETKPKPAFDTIVISICVAEAFPNNGLRPPVLLHFGAVPHHNGKWRAPPAGWKSQPAEGSVEGAPGTLPWIPLQLFVITKNDGGPAFVDPLMHGACIKLPLAEVVRSGVRGIEFVLKMDDGSWMQPGGSAGGNFYVELPHFSTGM